MLAVSNRSEGQSTIAQGLSATSRNANRRHTFTKLSLAFHEAPGSTTNIMALVYAILALVTRSPLMFGPRDYQCICCIRVLCTYRLRQYIVSHLINCPDILPDPLSLPFRVSYNYHYRERVWVKDYGIAAFMDMLLRSVVPEISIFLVLLL